MRKILDQNDPLLRKKAALVEKEEFNSPWLHELVQEMLALMQELGAVGVAAPQIGVSKQIIVFGTGYTKSRKVELEIPDTVLINPNLTILSDDFEYGFEGCLNFNDLRGNVPRASQVEYSGYDAEGNLFRKTVNGLEARIIQHEIDHLNGVLFVDRVVNPSDLMTNEELQARMQTS